MTKWSISHETKKNTVTTDVVGLLQGEVVSTKIMAHHCRGCAWLASRRGSKYKKKYRVAKDVVGLPEGDSKNASLTKIETY